MHLLLSILSTHNNSNNGDDNTGGRKPREAMNSCGLDAFMLLSQVLELPVRNRLRSLHADHTPPPSG